RLNSVSTDGSIAFGIGDRVGGGILATTGQAAVWTRAVGYAGVGWLRPGDDYSSFECSTPDGKTGIGESGVGSSGLRAFRWTAARLTESAGMPADAYVVPRTVTPDAATIFGQHGDTSGIRAFVWTAGASTDIGDLPGGMMCWPFSCTADGSVAVGLGNGDITT